VTNPYFTSQGPGGKTRPDNIKISRSALKFGPLSIQRVNTIPPMDYGRPGDLILIDNTDTPNSKLQSTLVPSAIGLWIKQPLSYSTTPAGTLVIGFPAGYTSAGDVIKINGTTITFNSPHTVDQAATDIVNAMISDLHAQVLGEALVLQEMMSGSITITDVTGIPSNTLGIYSQDSLSDISPNGAWLPLQDVATSGGPSAPTAASYITLAVDPTLTNERVLTSGVGIKLNDAGAGSALTLDHDITGVTSATESIVGTDEVLFYNTSTGNVEKTTIGGLPVPSINESIMYDNASVGIANPTTLMTVPATAIIRRVLVNITSAYPVGATMAIGDSGITNRLMSTGSIDLQTVGIYETSGIIHQYGSDTPITATIGGTPGFGNAQVYIDFIVP